MPGSDPNALVNPMRCVPLLAGRRSIRFQNRVDERNHWRQSRTHDANARNYRAWTSHQPSEAMVRYALLSGQQSVILKSSP
jgi:hypothetical protein